jgi:hypothetical protein
MWTKENGARYERSRQHYSSVVIVAEWARGRGKCSNAKRGDNMRMTKLREIVNERMYVLSIGHQWREIPKERHILVDTRGIVMHAVRYDADVQNHDGRGSYGDIVRPKSSSDQIAREGVRFRRADGSSSVVSHGSDQAADRNVAEFIMADIYYFLTSGLPVRNCLH